MVGMNDSTLEERRALRALRISQTRALAHKALAAHVADPHALNHKGRCDQPEGNLVSSVSHVWSLVQRQLGGGDGNELRFDPRGRAPKFCSAWSSAALAVNSVAAFLVARNGELMTTEIPGVGGPGRIEFEAKRSAGVRRRRVPNLDFVIEGDTCVFVESKATEYLTTSHNPLKPVYAERAQDVLSSSAARELSEIALDPHRYRLLDAPQLVKHLLAARMWRDSHNGRPAKLVYAYWEPRDSDRFPAFERHRLEIESLFGRLEGAGVALAASSWPSLWRHWAAGGSRSLGEHVQELSQRYDVELARRSPS
jgi:hypothetical protein